MPTEGSSKSLRFEVKAVAPEAFLPRLMAELRLHPACLGRLHPPRRVCNVYFDSPDLSRVRQNLAGLAQRSKLRYRWYGESWQGWPGALEFKNKSGVLGGKELIVVDEELDLRTMTWGEVWLLLLRALPEPLRILSQSLNRPVLINRYQRSYFATFDRKVRVTVDSAQEFYSQWARPRPNLAFRVPCDQLVVEVKADRTESDRVQAILDGLPLRVGRNSKYVTGVRACSEIL